MKFIIFSVFLAKAQTQQQQTNPPVQLQDGKNIKQTIYLNQMKSKWPVDMQNKLQ